MNSSLRTVAGSGIFPCSRLTPASLKATSLPLSEKVEKAFALVATSGCGSSAGRARAPDGTIAEDVEPFLRLRSRSGSRGLAGRRLIFSECRLGLNLLFSGRFFFQRDTLLGIDNGITGGLLATGLGVRTRICHHCV